VAESFKRPLRRGVGGRAQPRCFPSVLGGNKANPGSSALLVWQTNRVGGGVGARTLGGLSFRKNSFCLRMGVISLEKGGGDLGKGGGGGLNTRALWARKFPCIHLLSGAFHEPAIRLAFGFGRLGGWGAKKLYKQNEGEEKKRMERGVTLIGLGRAVRRGAWGGGEEQGRKC